jgi:diguanylate cyclase (GGDEF)-like protein
MKELKKYIRNMQGMYDVVRLVEPGSCHIIDATKAGEEVTGEKCYTVWGKSDRCSNCTSYMACIRNRVQEKTEIRDGVECHVISIPAPLEIDGARTTNYAIELVTVGNRVDDGKDELGNDLKNANEDALYVSMIGDKEVSDEVISKALLDSSIGIVCLDDDYNCIYANKQAFRMFHIPNELEQMQEFLKNWLINDKSILNGHVTSQFYNYEGKEYLYEIHSMPAYKHKPELEKLAGICLAFMDITDEATNVSGVKFRETHDLLTGIYNQEGLIKAVKAKISEEPDEKYYCISSNIRQFKLVNSLFGMEKGDEILKTIGLGLEKWCREGDVFGRMHSDEFVIFMKKDDFDLKRFETGIHEVARLIDNSVFSLNFQLGIYEVDDYHQPVYDMIDKARMAIDSIKVSTELAIAYYDEEMMKQTVHEQEVINSFKAALENGEFHIFLQPQVDFEGNVIGGEALARWIHPEKGIVPPARFIGVLENANLIYQMDRYIWELAAIQLSKWKGTDKEKYRISVNISPKDLQFLNIEVVFSELVEKYDIDPAKLNLEITETAIAGNIGMCIELMGKLREKGFLVEMDDFGSGYSSLNLLKDFQVDVLKIDMRFLDSTDDPKRAQIILENIIHMAGQLDMVVIAEGVETKDQLLMLDEKGCDLFQGYYFSKPVDVEAFEKFEGKI